jgi:hypothetical protein
MHSSTEMDLWVLGFSSRSYDARKSKKRRKEKEKVKKEVKM